MERAIFTEESSADIEIYLLTLAVNEIMQIETGVGIITVQRNSLGADAWLRLPMMPEKEIGMRCYSALEAFIQLKAVGQHYLAEHLIKQDKIEVMPEYLTAMTPLMPSLVALVRRRLADQLSAVEIVSANFDETQFVTRTDGFTHRQTLHYPLEREYIYAACDCLRFRGTLSICKHLVVIADDVLLAGNTETMRAAA